MGKVLEAELTGRGDRPWAVLGATVDGAEPVPVGEWGLDGALAQAAGRGNLAVPERAAGPDAELAREEPPDGGTGRGRVGCVHGGVPPWVASGRREAWQSRGPRRRRERRSRAMRRPPGETLRGSLAAACPLG